MARLSILSLIFRFRGLCVLACVLVLGYWVSVILWLAKTDSVSDVPVAISKDPYSPNIPRTNAHGIPHQAARNEAPTFVLILAYYRTGSTLIGDLFNQDDRWFYSYEPLHGINRHPAMRVYDGPTLDAPTNNGPREIVDMTSESISIIEAIMTCRMDLFYEHFLMTAFPLASTSFGFFNVCFHREANESNVRHCYESYVRFCRSKSLRIIKSIRINMSTVEYFLKKYRNFKVIHLIRDPRGSMCSLQCVRESWQWEKHCRRVMKDVTVLSNLGGKFPDRLREVIYERFARDPIGVARELYDFIGETMPSKSADWLYDKTLAGNAADGVSGTTRPNSLKVAYNWGFKIQYYYVLTANSVCPMLLKHGNFIRLDSRDDLHNFKIPESP